MTLQLQIPQVSHASVFLAGVRALNPKLTETQIVETVLNGVARDALRDISLIETFCVETTLSANEPRKGRRAAR